ncbi:MAG: hypothetical protein GXO17_06325 [Thermodesulfobacteria bacterium]|nr:hypothetical protein [Thermodesulfobacteriota bacterium]
MSRLVDKILDDLESLLSSGADEEAARRVREGALALFQEISSVSAGPSRDLLEEVALLGVVEAEKRLS